MYNENEYLSPTLDIVFKMMFGDKRNADMLENLLKTYLELDHLGKFELTNVEIPPEQDDGKRIRLDLRITTDKEEIDVEVQVYRDNEYAERSVAYWASMYNTSVKHGGSYAHKKTLSLNILGYTQFKECKNYISNFIWYDPQNEIKLTDNARITFVELPKIKSCTPEQIKNDDKVAWAAFFNARSKEEFNMLNQTTTNQNVQKAVAVIRELSGDEMVREIARKREEAIYTEISKMRGAREEGIIEGEARGIVKGEAIGIIKGSKETIEKVIKAMQLKGMNDSDINDIISSL